MATDNLGMERVFMYDPSSLTTPFRQISATGTRGQFRDMNDAGDVLYHQNDATPRVFLYTHDDQQWHVLPANLGTTRGGEFGSFAGPGGPVVINNNRLIAGNVEVGSTTTAYTYDYATGLTTQIPRYFRSIEINDAGTVVGPGDLKGKGSLTAKAITYNAVGGKKQLTDKNSSATTINEFGQVAGEIHSTSGSSRITDDAFIYDPVAKFWPISTLLQDSTHDIDLWKSQVTLGGAPDIQGISEPLAPGGYPLILGHKLVPGSMFPDGIQRRLGFILKPISSAMSSGLVGGSVPEPTTFFLLILLMLGLLSLLVVHDR
jgi:hypothetical protein